MTRIFGTDPVTAITEAEATGAVAEIFADIRETMKIPMLTSIWRTLVALEDGLAPAWAATKPLYLSGTPAPALRQLIEQADLPVPLPLASGQLASAGVAPDDLKAIRAIVHAYNRSNGMNMIALTALFADRADAPWTGPTAPDLDPWPQLRPLLEADQIDPDCWALLQAVNALGGDPKRPSEPGGLATLWRHLGQWPGVLAVIHAAFAPLHQSGALAGAMQRVHDRCQIHAAGIAHFREDPVRLAPAPTNMITGYVAAPGVVARMVTLGHILAFWLDTHPGGPE